MPDRALVQSTHDRRRGLSLIEAENLKLKGILDKRFVPAQAQMQLPDGKLGGRFYPPHMADGLSGPESEKPR